MAEPPPGWKPLAADTSYDAERVVWSVLRRLTSVEKFRAVEAMREDALTLAAAGARSGASALTSDEARLKAIGRVFGDDAERVVRAAADRISL